MSPFTPPDISQVEPPEGCVPIITPFGSGINKSFVDGDPEGERLRVQMFVREEDKRVISKIWWGPHAEGPPGHAHGGSMAAVLDHTMGVACWVEGYPVVAASITINFHRGLPLAALYTVENWVERTEGKKVYAAGKIYLDDADAPFSTGSGLFIAKSLDDFEELSQQTVEQSGGHDHLKEFFAKFPVKKI